jgi:hypothetical protein
MIGGGLGTIQDEHDSNDGSDSCDEDGDQPKVIEPNKEDELEDDCGDDGDDKTPAGMIKA